MMPKIPPQLIQMMKGGGNPQEIAMSMLQQNVKGNPILENIMNLANRGDTAAVEQICKNIIRSKGMDPDELMTNIQNQFG